MADFNPNPPPKRGPAVVVGGQRRRLIRRSNQLPRSNTTPTLSPESATASLVSSASGVATALVADADRDEDPTGATSQEPSSTMNFYPPTAGIPTDFRPSPKSRPSNTSYTNSSAADSPTPTTGSESKKKHGLFDSLKSKDHDRPSSSHTAPMPTSPLPPVTPCKAAQVLGIGPDTPSVGSAPASHSRYDGIYDGPPVRPVLLKKSSMPLLTRIKDSAMSRQTKFREEGVEPDPPKSNKFSWGSGNKKAMKMLDLLPSLGSSSKRAMTQKHAAASPPRHSEEDTKDGYSSDTELHDRRLLAQPVPSPISQRRMRKKGPKSLDRMSPITEASHDEHGTAYRNSEHATELDVISEYEHDYPPYSAPILPRSHPESTLTTKVRYELEDDDLSPSEETIEERAVDKEEHNMHPGTQVDMNRVVNRQPPAVVRARGPLQKVEDHLLDAVEKDLEARKTTLDKFDADRLKLDKETAALKVSHEKMKKDFEEMRKRNVVHDEPGHSHQCNHHDIEDDEDDEDLVSLRSSIDLDEEPTVHTATAMTFTRITPGMVKLVDIPPRKKKNLDTPVTPTAKVLPTESKPTFYKHNENSPFNERSERSEPKIDLGPLQASNYSRLTKAKKAKMPRDESRMLVQDWITNSPRPAEQRPVSERIDLDVLADQQIPPAPFPKEIRPTPPPKQPSNHICLKNGHIFHPINLKQVPDEVAINSLGVRPYLQTHVGIKQHVQVPICCEKCGEDVQEELWECEIAACRLGVCKACAEDMKQEWQ
ncbi:uncharacterized protein K460DRAFT_379948 [Cucurbitaria berberidis CBS 394.84]|uniref:Uncharacterized protein n=1 Tax=Cucurbitaria berberidis CBS 394.84 TaxID=1168544 RepID=A0A9P4GAE0_9PLEO|nr:uncharacterized protein K460DRAFT_379948 [Cucurbitaria berberidis CBS 394.84]KAF1841982.1 hypothetical protein K460DRAFT_379948 [Cucurbitaria berberidis CBS 394.84]